GVHDGQMTRDARTGCRPAPTGHEPRGPATSREDRGARPARPVVRAPRGPAAHDRPGDRRCTTGRGQAVHDPPAWARGPRPGRLIVRRGPATLGGRGRRPRSRAPRPPPPGGRPTTGGAPAGAAAPR